MSMVASYNLPDELYYTQDHAWIKVEGNLFRLGMTDFSQKLAGEITFIKLPKPGKEVTAGKLLSSMQSGKWAGRLETPFNVKIVEVNKDLLYTPQKINQDCYGEGWITLIEPGNLQEALGQLMNASQASIWLKGEIEKHTKKS